MPNTFAVSVSANVDNDYGANVYALAVKNDDVFSDPTFQANLTKFFKDNILSSSNGVVRMNVVGDPTLKHVAHKGSSSASTTITSMECTITDVFDNIGSSDTHTIPHAFVDYSVYVFAENDLNGLTSLGDAERHNAYTIESIDTVALNSVTAFLDYDGTDNLHFNKLTANIAGHEDATGNVLDYFVLAFVDPTVTEEQAHWFADQRGWNNYANVVKTGELSIPFASPGDIAITKVIGTPDYANVDNTDVLDVNDVNAGKVWYITKNVGPQDATDVGHKDGVGGNHYGTVTEFQTFSETGDVSHARIKQVRVRSDGKFQVDVSGFSAASKPTYLYLLAVERNENGIDTMAVTEAQLTTLGHQFAVPAPDKKTNHVFTKTFDNVNTYLVDQTGVATGVDSSKEYDFVLLLKTENPAHNDITYMLSDLQDPGFLATPSAARVTDSSKPNATFSNLALNAGDVTGDVTVVAHAAFAGTITTSVQVALSTDGALTEADLITKVNDNPSYVSSAASFTLDTTLEGYPVSTVSELYVYAVVTAVDDGQSYTFQKMVKDTTTPLSRDSELFATFGATSMSYGEITANVATVFNNSSTNPLTSVQVGLSKGAALSLPVPGDLTHFQEITTGLGISPGQMAVLNQELTFTVDTEGNDLFSNETYFVNVLVSGPSGLLHSSAEFDPSSSGASGVRELVVNFEATSGNIEISSVRTHDITVSVVNNGAGNKYVFTPAVTQINKGDTYVFDNSANGSSHPLYFTNSSSWVSASDTSVLFSQTAGGGIVTVTLANDSAETHLYAHCEYHNTISTPTQEMGSEVNPSLTVVSKSHTTVDVADASDLLKLVAYTYPLVTIADAYLAAPGAVVTVDFAATGSGVSPSATFLEKVIDINDDVHDATGTRNAHVYAWIQNSDGTQKSSIKNGNLLNTADRFHTYIGNVVYHTDELRVDQLSIIKSAGGLTTSNIDKYYVMAFDEGVTVPTDFASWGHLGSTFVDETDIDQAIDDVYVNQTVIRLTKKFVNASDTTTADILPGDAAQVVLLAQDDGGNYSNPFVYPVKPSTDVTGIYDTIHYTLAAEFSSTGGEKIQITGGQALGPGTVRAAAFSAPRNDPFVAGILTFVESASISTSTLTDLSTLSLEIDKVNKGLFTPLSEAPVSAVNRAYVYVWVHNGGTNSAVAEVEVDLDASSTPAFYNRVHGVVSGTNTVTIDASFFASTEQIDEYYVAVIKKDLANGKTDAEIDELITASVSQTTAVSRYDSSVILVNDVKNITGLGLTEALDASNTALGINSGTVYRVYLLAKNDGGTVGTHYHEFIHETSGVKAVSGLTIVNKQLKFNVIVDGFSGESSQLQAIAYTYHHNNPSTGINTVTSGPQHAVAAGTAGLSITGITLDKVIDLTGAEFDFDKVDTVHLYVWIKGDNAPYTTSSVFEANPQITDPYTNAPFAALHGFALNGLTEIVGESVSLFGESDGYYLFAALTDTITDKSDTQLYDFVSLASNADIKTAETVAAGHVFVSAAGGALSLTEAYNANTGSKAALESGVSYTVVLVGTNGTGNFDVARSGPFVVPSGNVPKVENFSIGYNSADVEANIETVDLIVPSSGQTETFSFYALARTSNPPNTDLKSGTAVVTIASGLSESVIGHSMANAFTKVVDTDGDVVDFKSVKTAYAYAWSVGDVSGTVGPVLIASNGASDGSTDPLPRVNAVSVNATELTLTVESASVFSASHNVDKYYIFAVKQLTSGDPLDADVKTFVTDHLATFAGFIDPQDGYSAFGEFNDFDPDLLEDDVYLVPGYMTVMTKAFTDVTDAAASEDVTSGNSYKVYMAATDTNGVTNLYTYPQTLTIEDTGPDPTVAQVGAIKNVTFDNSVQNYHTVSFGLESLTASSTENAKVYAAVTTRDLKYERYATSVGGYLNELYSLESLLTPIMEIPAGTSVETAQLQAATPNPFVLDKAVDTNGDLVDLYTVNAGHLYVWARTLGDTVDARSAIRRVDNTTSLPTGPYQLWVYMLKGTTHADNLNIFSGILLYDTPDAWPGSGGISTEKGNRLSYDYLTPKDIIPHNAPLTLDPDNTSLYSNYGDGSATISSKVPFSKLINIDASVKSVYATWIRPKYAFDIKLELRDASGNYITEFSDTTKSAMQEEGDDTSLATILNAAHTEWNIPAELPGEYQPGPVIRAIQTNDGASTFDSGTLSPAVMFDNSLTYMIRYKYNGYQSTGSGYMLYLKQNGGIKFGGISTGDTSDYILTVSGVDLTPTFSHSNGEWYTVVCRCVPGSVPVGYVNTTLLTSTTSQQVFNTPIDIDGFEINAVTNMAEIDYLVVVPDALTEAQMTSLYTDYSEGQDIAGFLSANSLSPTVDYRFNGTNTNGGSASGMPAITFQSPDDVYSDYTTQVLVQSAKNVLVPPPEYEWILVHRDVIDQNPGSTSITNVGTDADASDITKTYSRLGDLMVGHGDMADSLVKSDGKYTFRMIPYGPKTNINDVNDERETYDDVPFGTRYFEWSQTANPTLTDSATGDAGFQNDLTIIPAEFKQVYDDNSASNEFEGLAKSESSKILLDGERGMSGQYQYGVGYYTEYMIHGGRNFMYGPVEYRYKHPHKTELWVLAEKKATTPFEELFGKGWTMIKHLPGGSTTWFPGNDNLNLPEYAGQEFLFTTGDYSRWLICDQEAVHNGGVNYTDAPRTIKKSSISATPYTAKWYNRHGSDAGVAHEPWISLEDHDTSNANGTVMYIENGWADARHTDSIHSSGMYVYIR